MGLISQGSLILYFAGRFHEVRANVPEVSLGSFLPLKNHFQSGSFRSRLSSCCTNQSIRNRNGDSFITCAIGSSPFATLSLVSGPKLPNTLTNSTRKTDGRSLLTLICAASSCWRKKTLIRTGRERIPSKACSGKRFDPCIVLEACCT